MRWLLFLVLGIVALIALRWSFFTVDATEYVYVTVLGKHTATLDGSDSAEAGLHFGLPWPIQAVQRIDRRLQLFDLRPMELLMRGPDGESVDKNLLVEACVFWRIAGKDTVDLFIRRLGSAEQARNILGERITSQLGAAINSRMFMEDLVSTETAKKIGDDNPPTRVDEKVEELRKGLLQALAPSFRDEYGIELVDIRLRRYNYPGAARGAIFERIKSERRKKRKEYEAEGDFQARNIATQTEEKVRGMLAKAKFDEQKIKTEADAEAMVIRNRAHAQDPEFYEFLKKLEQYQTVLGEGRGMLLLSTHRPMFDLLFSPPTPEKKKDAGGTK